MDKIELEAIAKAVVLELKKQGYLSRRAPRPILSKDEQEKLQTDIYKENEQRVRTLVESKEFEKEKYNFSEEGPFDWRYIINKGKRLTPAKYILALYWLEKSKCKIPDWSTYKFTNKERAAMAMQMELADAKKLASVIKFSEFRDLVNRADARAYNEKAGDYTWEWKLATLLKELKND